MTCEGMICRVRPQGVCSDPPETPTVASRSATGRSPPTPLRSTLNTLPRSSGSHSTADVRRGRRFDLPLRRSPHHWLVPCCGADGSDRQNERQFPHCPFPQVVRLCLPEFIVGMEMRPGRRLRTCRPSLYGADKVQHCCCWAHARRKFVTTAEGGDERAEAALGYIGQLYAIERSLPPLLP